MKEGMPVESYRICGICQDIRPSSEAMERHMESHHGACSRNLLYAPPPNPSNTSTVCQTKFKYITSIAQHSSDALNLKEIRKQVQVSNANSETGARTVAETNASVYYLLDAPLNEKTICKEKYYPPLDYKCSLCNLVVTPQTPTTFNMHLKSSHFNQELLSEYAIGKHSPPYTCSHSSCLNYRSSNDSGDKEKTYNSSMDLLDHMIEAHDLVLKKYYKRLEELSKATNQSEKNVTRTILDSDQYDTSTTNTNETPSSKKENDIKRSFYTEHRTRRICYSKEDTFYVCILCKNQKSRTSNECLSEVSDESLQKISATNRARYMQDTPLPFGAFRNHMHLRHHLVDAHLLKLLGRQRHKETETMWDSLPITCFVFQVYKQAKLFNPSAHV